MKISQFASIRAKSGLVFGGIVLALSLAIDVHAQNVGVGFSSPQSKLSVNGNLAVGAGYNVAAPANGAIIQGTVGIGTSTPNTGYQLHIANAGGDAIEAMEGNSSNIGALLYLLNDSTTSRKTVIDMTQSGGTTGFQLDVDVSANNSNNFSLFDNATGVFNIYVSPADLVGVNNTAPRFQLETRGTIAVASGSYPTTENAFALGWDIIQPGLGVAEFVNYSGTGGGNAFDFFLVPNTGAPSTANVIASINHSGVYTGSDQRLKTGIQPLHYGLSEVMNLEPKEYDLHLGKSIKDGIITLEPEADHQIGFLAQDVNRLVPEAVEKPRDPANEIYKMNYSILVPVLVSAVQELKHLQDATVAEQRAQITEQQTKIAELEAKVASLEKSNAKPTAIASEMETLKKVVTTLQEKKTGGVRTIALSQ